MDNDKSELLDTLRVDRAAAPPRRSTNWTVYAAASVLLMMALGATAWFAFQDRTQPVRVAVAQPMPKTGNGLVAGTALLDSTGYVVARREATVGPKIPGKLRDVLVEEGMHVEAEQIIAHLDDSNALAALDQAKATLMQAETTEADARPVFVRSKAELGQGLISQQVFDTAKSTYDQARTAVVVARSALEVARQNEDDTIVRAPFTGVVTAKAAQPGEIVSPLSAGAGFTRTGIATIVDMDSLEVDVDVSENYINRVHAQQKCTATLNAYADWQIPCHVIAVVPTADRTKASVVVRVGFNVKDERILPEMGARVSFLSEGKPNNVPASAGVTVPTDAVVTSGGECVVFVVHDDRVERRAVKPGTQTPAGQIILSGLSSGETVALGDLTKLKDGAEIRIEQ